MLIVASRLGLYMSSHFSSLSKPFDTVLYIVNKISTTYAVAACEAGHRPTRAESSSTRVLYRDNSEQWCASPLGAHIASPVGAHLAPGGVGGSEPLAVWVEATQEARLAAAREVEHLLRG